MQTAGTAHTGSIPSAGPAVAMDGFGPDGRGGPPGGIQGGGAPQQFRMQAPPGGNAGGTGGPMRAPGGAGGLLDASEPSAEVTALLLEDADDYTWVAAAVGSNSAAGFQLATERPVMPIGGFNGSDPSPTLAEFQALVADGDIHWFIGSGGFGRSMGGSEAGSEIASWVADNFEETTVDGVTLYDLSPAATS